MAATKKRTSTMTDEHKAALAEGRAQSRAVRAYLDALEANRPKRGRKRTPDSMKKRLDQVVGEIATADPLKRVQLIQERIDLEQALTREDDAVDLTALEKGFVEVAAAYSKSKGITYAAWRELGIGAPTLKKAGIGRAGG
jgi:hypothetical protein